MTVAKRIDSIRKKVARMTVEEASNLRNQLDKTPAKDLPGAAETSPMQALKTYKVFRALLTARIQLG